MPYLKYYREESKNFPNHNRIVVENSNVQNLVNQITEYFKLSHLDVLFDLNIIGNVEGQYRNNKTIKGKFIMGKRCSEISFRNKKLISLLTIIHEVGHHWDYEKNGPFRTLDESVEKHLYGYRIKWRKAHTKKHKYAMKKILEAYDRGDLYFY